jgi:hypothetical protein
MNWKGIQRGAIDSAIWAWAHWYLIVAVFAGLLVLYIIATVRSCNERREENKIANTKTNITVGKVESNIAANEVKNAEENKNTAVNNYRNSLRIDSNHYTGANANSLFCRRYPNDPSCP